MQISRLCIALVMAMLSASSFAQNTRVEFKHPDRIRYDGDCLAIDGKDTLIYSGAFHYFRCPQPLWHDRLTKIKEAGFNAIETYVPWNWHERNEPKDLNDFSQIDLKELQDFLKMAHEEFGFYTIIRPGPYICSEWSMGGFPTWLMNKKPANTDRIPWVRSDDPAYLAWSKHWMDAVCKVIAPEQLTRKPVGAKGVILFQIENEYDLFPGVPQQQRITHLKSLYQAAMQNGIDVPIFTCWTKQCRSSKDEDLKNVFDAANCYPRWGVGAAGRDVDNCKNDQPDAPGMIAELQGGWFSNVGGKLSIDQDGVTASQINAITLMALQHHGTILNYYMLFGGTNFGYWPGRSITTTYDYASPIRETGGVGDKYLVVKAIGAMLKQIGESLARSKAVPVEPQSDKGVQFAIRESKDGSRFVFCFNSSRDEARHGEVALKVAGDSAETKIQYDLDKFGFKVLLLAKSQTDSSQGRWYPQAQPPIERPAVPATMPITAGTHAEDPFASLVWKPYSLDKSLVEQGILDARYVYLKATPTLTREQIDSHGTIQLQLWNGDPLLLRVNGKLIHQERGRQERLAIDLKNDLKEGENEIVILYESFGYSAFGTPIENMPGLGDGYLANKGVEAQIVPWRVQLADDEQAASLIGADVDDSKWQAFDLTEKTLSDLEKSMQPGAEQTANPAARILFGKVGTAVFRTSIEVKPETLAAPLVLELHRIDDTGEIYVNGKLAGHSQDFRKSFKTDISKFLVAGRNIIAVVVHNKDGQGGLTRLANVLEGKNNAIDLKWQLADDLAGVQAGWQTASSLPGEQVTLPTTATSNAMAHWYRFEFDTPKVAADQWIPFVASLQAKGNGNLYLNGTHIARYWEAGPQHDFYLPECWLKKDGKNVLLLALRPKQAGVSIDSLSISPVADQAEYRK